MGLRWRTEREVVIGKGQFVCGAKGCDERRALASYEVTMLLHSLAAVADAITIYMTRRIQLQLMR